MSVALARPVALGELATALGGELDPDLTGSVIQRIVTPDEAGTGGDLALLTSPRHATVVAGRGVAVLCVPGVASRLPVGYRWVHAHPLWVLAELLPEEPPDPGGIDLGAHVSPEASVHPRAHVAPGAVVLAGATIGADCRVGHNAVVYGGVRLGERVSVGPLSVLGRPGFGWTHAPDGRRIRVPHRGGVLVGDDVEIGALCTVDAGTLAPTVIAAGVKLDAHVHVGHNVRLGSETVVAGQVGFAGSVVVGERVLVGGQSGFADHVTIGANARIAGHSGVIGDVPAGATVAGFPAVPRMRWLRGMARLLDVARRRK